jgi:hypothetical protein
MVVLIIKQVAILLPLFAEKNIWESILETTSKGSTVNLKDFKTDAGNVGLLFWWKFQT